MAEDCHSSAARRASMRRASMGRARDPHLGWRAAVLPPLILYLLAAGGQHGASLVGETTPFWSNFGAEAAPSAPGVAEEELATLEVTQGQGQIISQSPTDATRFRWHLYGT